MDEKTKARIMDATKIRRVLARVATEIIERNRNLKNLVIVAVKTRGLAIGKRLARLIKDLEGVDIPVGLPRHTPATGTTAPSGRRRTSSTRPGWASRSSRGTSFSSTTS